MIELTLHHLNLKTTRLQEMIEAAQLGHVVISNNEELPLPGDSRCFSADSALRWRRSGVASIEEHILAEGWGRKEWGDCQLDFSGFQRT